MVRQGWIIGCEDPNNVYIKLVKCENYLYFYSGKLSLMTVKFHSDDGPVT